MLHGLAGFIFGRPSQVGESVSAPAGRENRCNAADDVQNVNQSTSVPSKSESLEIVGEDDDEWLMVDVGQDEHIPSELAAATPAAAELDLAIPSSVEASSGESSPSIGERGWNLTPPPCFTASFQREKRSEEAVLPSGGDEGKTVVGKAMVTVSRGGDGNDNEALNAVLETSNFENLLIEHPSMSVYGRIISHEPPRRRNAASAVAVAQGIDPLQKAVAPLPTPPPPSPQPSLEETTTINTVVRPVREMGGVAEVLLGTELSMTTSRRLDLDKQQRAERACKAKEMGANRVRRMNAVAMFPPQSNASPRKRRMKNHPAGRCNDRKCQ